ncbi:MAG: CdaR family protein, partial [Anaerolineae bacterium]
NLANGQIGRNTFAIAQNDIRLPPGIVIERVEPTTVTVVLDALMEKELPVQVDWVGSLPPDLIMVSATVTPATVRVYGGSLMVQDIGTIYTEPLPLDDIRKSGSLTANLVLSPPSLRLAPDSRERVAVAYVVKRRSAPEEP